MKPKFVAIIAIFEGVILLVLLLNSLGTFNLLPEFQFFGCGGEIYATAQSPDGKRTAYAFERDCGATTGFATFVIVRDSESDLDLADDLIDDEIIFSADGDYHPQLKWLSKDIRPLA